MLHNWRDRNLKLSSWGEKWETRLGSVGHNAIKYWLYTNWTIDSDLVRDKFRNHIENVDFTNKAQYHVTKDEKKSISHSHQFMYFAVNFYKSKEPAYVKS